MGKIIVVASGKGGTGKTTTVASVASCLAALGHTVLCLDCDVGLGNLDIMLGLSGTTSVDFEDVLSGRIAFEDAFSEHPDIENLYFIAAPSSVSPDSIDRENMAEFLGEVRQRFEYCFIDAPAGIGAGFRLALTDADTAIVVVTGDASSIRDGQRVVEELLLAGIEDIRLIVNRVKSGRFRKTRETVDDVIDTVGAQLLGIVQEDEAVIVSANKEVPLVLFEGKRAAMQFLRIARRIEGKVIPLKRV